MGLENSVDSAGASEPPPTLDASDLAGALRDLLDPRRVANETPRLAWDLARALIGSRDDEFPGKDKRFSDPTWRDNPIYRRLGQSYLAWSAAMERLADNPRLGWKRRTRAEHLARVLAATVAPTNTLVGNPAAVKRAFETGGVSLLRAARNVARDVVTNHGLPSQADLRPFKVGENLACTPGAVVYREEMFELMQYTPTTATVRQRPLLMVPPQINKYYFVDLAPGKSFIEYTVGQGFQFFTISWRNPRPGHGHWGMEDYVAAVLRAIDITLDISGSEDLNLLGVCAGGLTTAFTLNHLTRASRRRVHSAAFMVAMIDAGYPNLLAALGTPKLLAQLRRRADQGEVFSAPEMARSFAWQRPKDLIFNFLVNDWLVGEDAPASDVMAWNVDMAGLPCGFQRDMMTIYGENLAAQSGRLTILGTPVDLSKIECDNFIAAGVTDHITPWRACYMTSQLLGGESEVVVALTGHVLTMANPLNEPRARYRAGPKPGPNPDEWFDQTELHQGSWWPRWSKWLGARSGEEVAAPAQLGNHAHPATDAAPGRYVHET